MPNVSIVDEKLKVLRTFEVKYGELIFNALEEQGYTLPHGCLAGSCSACRVEIAFEAENALGAMGPVERDTLESFLKKNPQHQGKNLRLSCRTKVMGDIGIRPI